MLLISLLLLLSGYLHKSAARVSNPN